MEVYRETVRDMLDSQMRVFKKTEGVLGTHVKVVTATHGFQIIDSANSRYYPFGCRCCDISTQLQLLLFPHLIPKGVLNSMVHWMCVLS